MAGWWALHLEVVSKPQITPKERARVSWKAQSAGG